MRYIVNRRDHYRSKAFFVVCILPLLLIVALCISSGSSSSYSSLGFVSASGQKLILNGLPFRFVGVNRYDLLSSNNYTSGCGDSWTHKELDRYFAELKQVNINALRFWAFQQLTKGTDFSTFDYLIVLSAKYNMKLIPVLENQWANCTQGGYKYASWYRSGYLAPYGNYRLSFKNYVNRVVSRYKNSQEIMMWQIMNEAESTDQNNNPDFQALHSFVKDISSYIRTLDPNHLISLGTIGSDQPGMQGDDYRQLYAIPTLDILEYHDYNHDTSPLPGSLSQRFADAKALNKPLFVGESGIKSQCAGIGCYTQQQRAELFKAKMNAFFKEGGAGYLIWSYRDNHYDPQNMYEFDASDPLSRLVSNVAQSWHVP